MTKVLNFGSLNLDYTYRVEHFVQPGETLSATSRTLHCGGKGLNQSIALAQACATVYHAGAVGAQDGQILIDYLNKFNVDTSNIVKLESVDSGNAFIQVDDKGENSIVLYQGANHAITKKFVDQVFRQFGKGDWLVLQNEINQLDYIISKAKKKKMTICFNPSPITNSIFELPLDQIDYFFLNEHEAKMLCKSDSLIPEQLLDIAPNGKFIVTFGEKGSMYLDKTTIFKQKAFPTKVVDTTAAGDTFTGFVVSALILTEGKYKKALNIGAKASALAISKPGASSSIPSFEDIITTKFD